MTCPIHARVLGRCVEATPLVPFLPEGALRTAVLALAVALSVPMGADAAKGHLAGSMGVPVEAFTFGQLIELKGAVENGAGSKATAIMVDVGLGDLPTNWTLASR